jgi:hypothetical protein
VFVDGSNLVDEESNLVILAGNSQSIDDGHYYNETTSVLG